LTTAARAAEIGPLVPEGVPVYVAPAQVMNEVPGIRKKE